MTARTLSNKMNRYREMGLIGNGEHPEPDVATIPFAPANRRAG